MKILVTGVAGLIGSNFARFLQKHGGYDVIGVDDLSCGLVSNIPKDITFRRCTIGCGGFEGIMNAVRPDVVYHFAAYAAECLSPFIRKYNYRNNLVATAEVVTACIKTKVHRLVFTSSMAVYGDGDPPFTETDYCNPIDPYGVAKLACEQDIRIAGVQHGLDWCILRPHNVYGPGQVCNQKYRNVFGIWMNRVKEDLPILVYGDGSQRRAFTHIDDMMYPLWHAGLTDKASKQIINLGGQTTTSLLEAAQIMSNVVGGWKIEHAEGRHEVANAWCTVGKSMQFLGYSDSVPLSYGLKTMWKWFLTHPQEPSGTPDFELEEGLPSYWIK